MKKYSNCNLLKGYNMYSNFFNMTYQYHVEMDDESELDELTRMLKY